MVWVLRLVAVIVFALLHLVALNVAFHIDYEATFRRFPQDDVFLESVAGRANTIALEVLSWPLLKPAEFLSPHLGKDVMRGAGFIGNSLFWGICLVLLLEWARGRLNRDATKQNARKAG